MQQHSQNDVRYKKKKFTGVKTSFLPLAFRSSTDLAQVPYKIFTMIIFSFLIT